MPIMPPLAISRKRTFRRANLQSRSGPDRLIFSPALPTTTQFSAPAAQGNRNRPHLRHYEETAMFSVAVVAQRSGIRLKIVVLIVAVAAALAAKCDSLVAQGRGEEKSWQGTWNNRARGTSGPLRCTGGPTDGKSWEAQFDGMFMKRSFSYKATMEAAKKGDRTLFQGTTTVDGDTYRWTGYINGRIFTGKFRSAQGNNGDFRLQEVRN
jgi:hypothetical protein